MSKKTTRTKSALISIIVPAHNSAKFLRKCLDALLAQTFSNLEIICVDDHSTDDTMSILKRYAERDSRIKVLTSTGQGVSAARNCGLRQAKGAFIMFCDADDYYDPNMCEHLHDTIIKTKADLVASELRLVYTAHREKKIIDDAFYALKYEGLQPTTDEIILSLDNAPTNKIFRRSILRKYDIWFPEGRFYEDSYFCYAYFCVSRKIFFLNEQLYNYVRHSHSIMSDTWSEDNQCDTSLDHLYVIFAFYDFLKRHRLTTRYNQLFWRYFLIYNRNTLYYSKSKANTKKARQLATSFIRKHRAELNQADPTTRNEILALNPRLSVFDLAQTKRRLLRFLPSYHAQLRNLWRTEDLLRRNQRLLDDLHEILKK